MYPYLRKLASGILKMRFLNQRGMVLPWVLTFAAIFGIVIGGLGAYAGHSFVQARADEDYMKTFYIAEAAVEKGIAQVRLFVGTQGRMPTANELSAMASHPPTVGSNYSYNTSGGSNTYSLTLVGNLSYTKLTSGDYAGLNANTQKINISVTTRSLRGWTRANITLNQNVEIQNIPIFQFGVFYMNDLEILPGANMTFTGPVYTASDLWVGSENGVDVNFSSTVYAAGNIYHGRKDGNHTMPGNVYFKDANYVDQNMKNPDGSWLDSNYPTWALESQQRWGGTVQSIAQKVQKLTLPLPSSAQSGALIDRRSGSDSTELQSQKMDYKANIRIVDGVAVDQAGAAVELRYCSGGSPFSNGCPQGQTVVSPIQTSSFYNFREAKTIQTTDIDVSLLNGSPTFQAIVGANNGVIIYTSDHRNLTSTTYQDATRIVNASLLPTKGLTLASENPVYVKGDYNTVNKQPSSIMGDAFNMLSNNWSDANSAQGLGSRIATPTSVNAAVLAGNADTGGSTYGGGFENMPRFLENWSGTTFNYSGSVIALFNSRIATGAWVYGGNNYTAPIRMWSFDTSFQDINYFIPGVPAVFHVARTGYELT